MTAKPEPSMTWRYRVDRGCTYCNTCVFECPTGAIQMTDAGAQIDEASCIGCGRCAENCASEAISRVRSASAVSVTEKKIPQEEKKTC